MNCDVGEVIESLENEQSSRSCYKWGKSILLGSSKFKRSDRGQHNPPFLAS